MRVFSSSRGNCKAGPCSASSTTALSARACGQQVLGHIRRRCCGPALSWLGRNWSPGRRPHSPRAFGDLQQGGWPSGAASRSGRSRQPAAPARPVASFSGRESAHRTGHSRCREQIDHLLRPGRSGFSLAALAIGPSFGHRLAGTPRFNGAGAVRSSDSITPSPSSRKHPPGKREGGPDRLGDRSGENALALGFQLADQSLRLREFHVVLGAGESPPGAAHLLGRLRWPPPQQARAKRSAPLAFTAWPLAQLVSSSASPGAPRLNGAA